MVSLGYIIERKYSTLLKVEDNWLYLRPGFWKPLQERHVPQQDASSEKGPKISATITITNVDQEICQHFLWDIAHMAIRDKFRFNFDDESAHRRLEHTKISANAFEAHHHIVQQTFKFLENEPDELTSDLGPYMLQVLPTHLRYLRKDGSEHLLPRDKVDIGHKIWDLFESDRVVKRHKLVFGKFVWDKADTEEFRTWLDDPVATRLVSQKWLRDATLDVDSGPKFLSELRTTVVKQWLEGRDWNEANAHDWVKTFMFLVCVLSPSICAILFLKF